MAKSSGHMRFSFSKFRRNPSATDRRFCMMWINKMVKEQVEKQIAELRREFLFMDQALREEMVAELQEQLRELLVEEPGNTPLHCSNLDRELSLASRWQKEKEEEYKNIDKDEGNAEKSLRQKTLAFSEIHSDTNSIFIVKKSLKKKSLRIPLRSDSSDTVSSDGVTSEGNTRNISNDVQTKPELAKCRQQKNQSYSTDVTPICNTSQSMKESEEGDSTRNPFHAKPSLMSSEVSHENEKVHVDSRKEEEEEALLMDRQWKEWLDKQEMKGSYRKEKPVESQDMEKKAVAASGVSEKKKKQNLKRGDTMKKFKTYISDVFSSRLSHKWEKFENED